MMEQPPSDPPVRGANTTDLLAPVMALAWGILNAAILLPARNPRLLPYAQDSWEYLGFTRHLLEPLSGAPTAYRYPLFPWLASLYCTVTDQAPYLGNIAISVVVAALLPIALYLLGRQLAPAWLALGGAVIASSLPSVTFFIGQVSDYMFCTWLQILSAAASLWAVRHGRVTHYAVAGVALAAYLAGTPKALTWFLAAMTVLVLRALLDVRAQPRRVALQLAGLLAPAVIVWGAFSSTGWMFASLEHATDLVFSNWLGSPPTTGVHPVPGELWPIQEGWIVGESGALLTLPRTIGYLREVASVARDHGSVSAGLALLRQEIPLGVGGAMFPLACIGVLGPVLIRTRHRSWPGVVAAVLLAALLLGSQLLATGSLPPYERFHLATILILPVFLFAGLGFLAGLVPQLRRANPWIWALPALICIGVAEGSSQPVGRAHRQRHAATLAGLEAPEISPFGELASLRPELEPQDQVLDFTPDAKGSSVLLGAAAIDWKPHFVQRGSGTITLLPLDGPRRFIVGPCTADQVEGERGWRLIEPGDPSQQARLSRLSPCVWEDTRPGHTGILSRE